MGKDQLRKDQEQSDSTDRLVTIQEKSIRTMNAGAQKEAGKMRVAKMRQESLRYTARMEESKNKLSKMGSVKTRLAKIKEDRKQINMQVALLRKKVAEQAAKAAEAKALTKRKIAKIHERIAKADLKASGAMTKQQKEVSVKEKQAEAAKEKAAKEKAAAREKFQKHKKEKNKKKLEEMGNKEKAAKAKEQKKKRVEREIRQKEATAKRKVREELAAKAREKRSKERYRKMGCYLTERCCPAEGRPCSVPRKVTKRDRYGEDHMGASVSPKQCLARAMSHYHHCDISDSQFYVTAKFAATNATFSYPPENERRAALPELPELDNDAGGSVVEEEAAEFETQQQRSRLAESDDDDAVPWRSSN